MNATYRLVKDALLSVQPCPDGPLESACPSCNAAAVVEALEVGASMSRHPAGTARHDDQLDIVQAVCEHVWPGELGTDADCNLCGLSYAEFEELQR